MARQNRKLLRYDNELLTMFLFLISKYWRVIVLRVKVTFLFKKGDKRLQIK